MINVNIKKELYGSNAVMNLDIDFCINEGEFIALTGDSGSGKTTLLRILAGLEEATGEIQVDNKNWLDTKTNLKPQKRQIGFVFQDYALFENMTILKNLLFVSADKELALRLLNITELTQLKDRYPNKLSGGQKQRVALCRAMMSRPKLLLLDEPLSALDKTMRTKLQDEILMLHKEFKTTTIMVSHDPSEIYKLATRVTVLKNGTIVKDGKTKDILLKQNGSQKFSFTGELLELKKVDVIFIAVLAIGQQLVEIVLSKNEIDELKVGDIVTVSTKAFSPILTKHSI